METLTDEKFKETVYKVLEDYEIPNLDTKLKNGGKLHSLLSTINNLYAYQMWSSKHIYSTIPKNAIASKNIDNYLSSQIKHIETTMQICQFQYNSMYAFFELFGMHFGLKLLMKDKESFINYLYDLHMRYWTDLESFHHPFELIRNFFMPLFDIKNLFPEGTIENSDTFTNAFACSFLNTYSFFHAFNITEKRIKTSFSIHVYQELCNLSLSKYKTKEITDTIMHHLDIDTTINLRKIDQVQCIGQIGMHQIDGYDAPLIPLKFLDHKLIHTIQNQHIQEAINNHNENLADEWKEIQINMGFGYHVQKYR